MTQSLRLVPALLDAPTARELLERVAANLNRVLVGKSAQVRMALTCLSARGHLLLEDVPGVGKTTLAEAIARSLGLAYGRVQFTADLLPSDILGAQIFLANEGRFEFRRGPLFHQLVLADELNRAPPRTQSALLEAMAQHQVSVDGVTHTLPRPFVVVATQNPVDLSGTYPLPDSQLDRFLMRLTLGHPSPEVEAKLLIARGEVEPVSTLTSVAGPDEFLALHSTAAQVRVDEAIAGYAMELITATRQHPDIERGVSTRAALALIAAARAHALWEAREFVTPGDVRAVLSPTLSHRLVLRSAVHGNYARDEASHLLEELARQVRSPR